MRRSVLTIERYVKLSVIMCLLFLVACVIKTKTEDLQVVKRQQYEQQAQMLYTQGRYQQAAILFQRLADKSSAQQNVYRLQAAEALLKIEQNTKAKTYLGLIAASDFSQEQGNQLNLLNVQLLINFGNAERAIARWQLMLFSSLNRVQQRRYYELGIDAYALLGDTLEGVQQRIALNASLDSSQRQENSIAILEGLVLMPEDTLEEELSQQQNQKYQGWLDMALIVSRFPKGAPGFRLAIEGWSRRYLQHQGQVLLSSGYFVPAGIILGDVSEIAILLPESGPYKAYANAIKTGILEAYRRHERDALQPDIQFHDTREMSIVALYQQVVAHGVQLVIGPLNKKRVVELAENTELTVPVLALNYVEGLVKDNLYQFALSPIDEVQQVVKRAWSEGYRNAIILTPETAEGERISLYFQNAWEALDGNVLVVQTFKPGERDFSVPVRQLLNVDESQARFQKFRKEIGYLEYNPRRRRDVDVIFVVANNSVARLINPQFYHNRAKSVAVYGLSRIYSGRPSPKKNIDLENVGFCNIPWLFDQAYQGDLDKQTLKDIWQPLPDKLLSLIPFGIDAYTLIPYLNDLASIPYKGATGSLLLNEYNRIERHLVCAKFINGEVVLYDTQKGGPEKNESTSARITE